MAIDVLTADELGELLRLSANRVLLLARRGDIPYFRIDGRVRFDAQAIEGWLERFSNPRGKPPKLIEHEVTQESPSKVEKT